MDAIKNLIEFYPLFRSAVVIEFDTAVLVYHESR